MITIGQILEASCPAVRLLLLNDYEWISPELRKLTREGRLTIRPLGPCVEYTASDGTLRHTTPQQITIPIIWTADDDQGTAKTKIELASLLLRHAFEAMDQVIFERIGAGRAVASKQYRYDLGEVHRLTHYDANTEKPGAHCVKLFTAIAFLEE